MNLARTSEDGGTIGLEDRIKHYNHALKILGA